MSFEKNFCSSPWFHMRVNNRGYYEFCRWSLDSCRTDKTSNIRDVNSDIFFQKEMSDFRLKMINGEQLSECARCDEADRYNKVSGRQRQLIKTGINPSRFEKTLLSSPWLNEFSKTLENNGETDLYPVDWQIDLGNYCNSACVFCIPKASSKVASEWKKLNIIETVPEKAWCDDLGVVKRFARELSKIKNLKYLHFVGGETLITPAFKTIIKELIKNKKTDITIGFTTNLTVWDHELINLFKEFENINVGLSIEAIHPINDYLRWPSNITSVMEILDKWVSLSKQNNWLTQIRITPSVFSIFFSDTVYQYALENELITESCNFLEFPSFMRISLLPQNLRQEAILRLTKWFEKNSQGIDLTQQTIINTRNHGTHKLELLQDVSSYIEYLKSDIYEEHLVPELINFIKKIEANRNNSILDYLPEYEEFLRSAGY